MEALKNQFLELILNKKYWSRTFYTAALRPEYKIHARLWIDFHENNHPSVQGVEIANI